MTLFGFSREKGDIRFQREVSVCNNAFMRLTYDSVKWKHF